MSDRNQRVKPAQQGATDFEANRIDSERFTDPAYRRAWQDARTASVDNELRSIYGTEQNG